MNARYSDALRGYAHEVLRRDDFVCRYCGLDGKVWPNWLFLSWDHLLPPGHPRKDDEAYIVAACRFCNEAGNRHVYELEDSATGELKQPGALVEQKRPVIRATVDEYRGFWERHVAENALARDSVAQRVTAAVLFQRGRLLLAKRTPHSSLPGVWELPGGKVESGETPESCLAREMREEFGVEVAVGELFGTNTHAYDHGCFEILAYPIEIVAGELQALEHEAFDWFLPSEVEQLDVAPADIPIVRALLSQEAPPQDEANG